MREAAPARDQKGRRRAYHTGHGAEIIAAWFLRLKGWRILKRRYRTKAGEIDLIARRGRTLVFVEVKARKNEAAALEAVTPAGRKRIIRAAKIFLSEHPKAGFFSMRFDVIAVTPWRLPLHVVNAFEAHD